jgi:hypothetical protein
LGKTRNEQQGIAAGAADRNIGVDRGFAGHRAVGAGRHAAAIQSGGTALTSDQAAARASALEAQVASLQQQINELKKAVGAVTPSWKGAPQLEDKQNGWSFKPRGLVQYDAGYVENPEGAITQRQSRLQQPAPAAFA